MVQEVSLIIEMASLARSRGQNEAFILVHQISTISLNFYEFWGVTLDVR
jgi:hypothetical protein